MKDDTFKLVQEYNKETGELVKEYTVYTKDKEKLTQWRQDNMFPCSFKGVSRFTKLYHKELPKFSLKPYYGNFYILLHHLAPEFNYLGKLTKEDGWLPLTKKEIQDILEISASTLYLFLKECQELKIIMKLCLNDKEEYYMVNPIYGFNGKNLSLLLYFVFNSDPKFIKAMAREDIEYVNTLRWEDRKFQFENLSIK